MAKGSSGGGGKAKIFYATLCQTHGGKLKHQSSTNQIELRVSRPESKKQKLHGGCPICAK
jgi:hypothetical protein